MAERSLWTRTFVAAAAERAVKTLAQAEIAFLGIGEGLNTFAVDWKGAAGVGLGAAVLSLLTSVASAPVSPQGTPSLVGEQPVKLPPVVDAERLAAYREDVRHQLSDAKPVSPDYPPADFDG